MPGVEGFAVGVVVRVASGAAIRVAFVAAEAVDFVVVSLAASAGLHLSFQELADGEDDDFRVLVFLLLGSGGAFGSPFCWKIAHMRTRLTKGDHIYDLSTLPKPKTLILGL